MPLDLPTHNRPDLLTPYVDTSPISVHHEVAVTFSPLSSLSSAGTCHVSTDTSTHCTFADTLNPVLRSLCLYISFSGVRPHPLSCPTWRCSKCKSCPVNALSFHTSFESFCGSKNLSTHQQDSPSVDCIQPGFAHHQIHVRSRPLKHYNQQS